MRKTQSYANSPTIGLLRALTEAYQHISRSDDQQSAAWGLVGSEFDVIATLGNTEGMRMCELAERSLNTKSNLTRVVKELERRGLVVRRRNPRCEREVFVRLTPEGEVLFVTTYPQKYEFLRSFFQHRLTEEEQRQLTRLLIKLAPAAPCCGTTESEPAAEVEL